MLLFVWALFCTGLARALVTPSVATCTAIKTASPCGLLEAGCMCNVAFVQFVDGMLPARCGWQRPYHCPPPQNTLGQECVARDDVLLRDRIRRIRNWLVLWESIGMSPKPCYDHVACVQKASQIVAAGSTLHIPYGMGDFQGPAEWCEFVGLTTHHVSRHSLTALFLSRFNDKDVVYTEDSVSIVLATSMIRAFAMRQKMVSVKIVVEFEPCSAEITSFTFTSGGEIWLVAGGYVKTAQHSSSVPWICARMSELCGAETTAACEARLGALPALPSGGACSPSLVRAVRFAELLEIDPEKYCPDVLDPPCVSGEEEYGVVAANMDARIADEGSPEFAPARARVCF